jgi:hypothetical protein
MVIQKMSELGVSESSLESQPLSSIAEYSHSQPIYANTGEDEDDTNNANLEEEHRDIENNPIPVSFRLQYRSTLD